MPIFSADGKPLGMFPKHQASTMCVDVVSVYSPPVEADFKMERSPSGSSSRAETSSITSSASSSSVNSNFNDDPLDFDPIEPTIPSTDDEIHRNLQADQTPFSLQSIDFNSSRTSLQSKHHQNNQQNIDYKSSSASMTPVNKNFPRSPFDSNTSSMTQLATASSSSSPHSSTTDLMKQKQRTSSQSSNATLISPKPRNTPIKNKKQSSFSLISQISDDLMSDVASKARSLSNKANMMSKQKLANLLSDETNEPQTITNSTSNMSIKDSNNNVQMNKSNSTMFTQPAAQTPMPLGDEGTLMTAAQPIQSQSDAENQLFLKEVLNSVLEGQGVGWLKYNRVKRLMEDENYRNFVLSRLNTSLDKKLSNDEEHIEDVKVNKAVFKGMSKLLMSIIHGLEQTYANNGLGGMASAFQLLEIAHTHYWVRGEAMSRSTDGAISPMSEHSDSPYASRENLAQISSTNNLPGSNSGFNISQVPNAPSKPSPEQQFQIQSTGSIVAQLG